MDDTGTYIANLYDGTHYREILQPQDIVGPEEIVPTNPQWNWRGIALGLVTVGAIASVVGYLASDRKLKEDPMAFGAFLMAVGTLLMQIPNPPALGPA
jgi:hypothetical protein